MNKLKKFFESKVLKYTTTTAMCAAYLALSLYCRTWFHQPKMPQKLIDLEMQ